MAQRCRRWAKAPGSSVTIRGPGLRRSRRCARGSARASPSSTRRKCTVTVGPSNWSARRSRTAGTRWFLASLVTPGGGRAHTIQACEKSLRRLGTDHLDLYLLHWAGGAFSDTVEAFEQLVADGKIRRFGVSNLDAGQLQRFCSMPGGEQTSVNQLLFNLNQRGIEWELLPRMQRQEWPRWPIRRSIAVTFSAIPNWRTSLRNARSRRGRPP